MTNCNMFVLQLAHFTSHATEYLATIQFQSYHWIESIWFNSALIHDGADVAESYFVW